MLHKFSMNGVNVVMDINSGAVHVVDDVLYAVVDRYKETDEKSLIAEFSDRFSKEELNEAIAEIKELEKEEMLFSKDYYEEVIPTINKRNPVVKALCLHIAHDCNLKCKYCFAEEGEYHGHRSLMSLEVGKKALDFILENSGQRKNLEVDFFGGEPLMNWQVVKDLVEYGKEREKEYGKNFRFTLTTNGMLLDDDIQDFANKHMHNVVLSLDGRKEVNDSMRPRAGGQGSYDVIVPKFKKMAESRNQTDYYIRGTYTRNNLDFYNDVMHIADLGFKQISVEPVVGAEDMHYSLREEDLPMLFNQYEKLAADMYERDKKGEGFNFFHFNIDLQGGPCVAKRLAGCGSGTEYLAVTPEGDLYPCHQFVGMPEFKMGTVYEGVTNTERREEFSNCNVYAKPECRECWCKFYCSGGCAANAYQFHGNILAPYKIGCELQKKRVECAIMLKAKAFNE